MARIAGLSPPGEPACCRATMYLAPNDNPLLVLTPRQAEACTLRLSGTGRTMPLRAVARQMGITVHAVEQLIDRGLRRLGQSGFPVEEIRRRLGVSTLGLRPAA